MNDQQAKHDQHGKHDARDASSLRVLGVFFAILGGIVLIATFFALAQPRAAFVNAISGLVLSGVGFGMFRIAERLERRERGE
jgi:hypothetical protein